MLLLGRLDRFGGAMNVLGRVLGAGEMRRMTVAENICKWYQAREQAENVVSWSESNLEIAERLNEAHRLAVELKLIEE